MRSERLVQPIIAPGGSVGSGGPRPWRLGVRARKWTLVVHIASAGAWLGIDVVMAVLIFTSLASRGDTATVALCYQVLELVAVWPLFAAGLVCLATGLLLGLGSKYGLLRYWWVATKLALNLLLTGLVLLALRPGLAQLARVGRELAAGQHVDAALHGMIYPPIVSPIALIVALLLAVFKPWGRIRSTGGLPVAEAGGGGVPEEGPAPTLGAQPGID
ncbi:hypothetical protein GCM10023322_32830 [Rugosimonospora acidiphila]|uniref:DUF2269 domain-containing protein n=1 Tax=Rugosimonospora acidiphila TaxID=556531 RepID=A0ABP9RU11_9ACTN